MSILLTEAAWSAEAGPLIALWTDAARAYALYQPGRLVAVALTNGAYPALSPRHPGAAWFERLAHDLAGAVATGATDQRPAIEQSRAADGKGAWPEFAAPAGPGAHALGLGPVHGSITAPAHFRFSLRGEQVLGVETRHGYQHRGILGLIRHKSPRLAARYAARVAAEATVAHSLAFARAAEAALGVEPPPRAVALRGVMAEIERLVDHLAALAAACAAVPQARLGQHQEALRAAAGTAFGHRLMMDAVIPGGVAGDIAAEGVAVMRAALARLEADLPRFGRLFESAAMRGRLSGIGVIPPVLAAAYGAGGITGRAAGQPGDARRDPGYPPYDGATFAVPTATEGDAAARSRLRLAEVAESARLVRLFLGNLPAGIVAVPSPVHGGEGLGVAEAAAGPVWYWLSINAGEIADVFIADPATLHWPLLEQAAKGALADFPLVASSINPSVSAVDL